MLRRLLRSLVAVLALGLLVAGVPVALVLLVGLPTALPSADDLGAALSGGPTTGVLVVALAVVLWLAWARLMVALLVELGATLRPHRRGASRSLGPSQRIAAFLLSGVIGLVPVPAHAAPAPGAAVAAQASPSTGPVVAPPDALRAARASTWTVAPGDSLWRVAEEGLGDGTRWREVHEANLGVEVAPDVRYREESVLQPGWVLRLPQPTDDPSRLVTVRPGDSLSAIANRELGDPNRWPELFEANEGRSFGGRTFDDPSLVLAGWQLVLPGEPGGGPSPVGATVAPPMPVPSPGDARPAVAIADTPSSATEATEPETAPAPPTEASTPQFSSTEVESAECPPGGATAAEMPPAAGADAPPTAMPAPPDSMEVASASETDDAVEPGSAPSAASEESGTAGRNLFLGGGALLGTGLIGLVAARRRNALRGASRDATVRLPSPAAEAAERSAVVASDPLAVARLDLALRSLVTVTHGDARPQWVRRDPDGTLVVGLVEPVLAPSPWQEQADGELVLPASTPTSSLVASARSAGAPCPALVELGHSGDGAVLAVDLEALGVLSLVGPSTASERLARAILATLATSPMADRVQVVTTMEVPALGERVLVVDHVDAALDAALALAAPVRTAVASGGHVSASALRALDPAEAWDAVILAVIDGGDDLPLDLDSVRGSAGLGVVTTREHRGAWQLRAAPDARWVLEPLGIAVRPVGLAARELDAIATLLLEAEDPFTSNTETASIPAARTAWSATTVVVPPPEPELPLVYEVGSGRSPWAPPHHAAPRLTDPASLEDEQLVGALDAADTWSILVRVLGQPEVVDRALTPVRFEKAKAAELVAWLVEHADAATRSGARAAMWESDVRDATFANVVSEARRAMARAVPPPSGEEWIGRGQGERLPLHPGVRTDVDVLRSTARVCRDLPDRLAIPALRRVLALIRDVPYAGCGYLWPDADGRTSAAIVVATSAAADLASRMLDAGDVDGAFWATEQGLRVLPGHEELVCLRMEAHARTGDLSGVRAEYAAYERALLADPWGDGTVAVKVASTRSRLLTSAGVAGPSVHERVPIHAG